MRIAGIVLLVLGVLAVVYGGFWYATDDTTAAIGPLKVTVESRDRVNVPTWAGAVAIASGALLWTASRRSRT